MYVELSRGNNLITSTPSPCFQYSTSRRRLPARAPGTPHCCLPAGTPQRRLIARAPVVSPGTVAQPVLPVPHDTVSQSQYPSAPSHCTCSRYPTAPSHCMCSWYNTPRRKLLHVLNGYPLHEYCCMPRFFSGHLLSNWPELLFISKQSHLPHATLPPRFDCRMSAPWGTDSLPVHSGHLHGIDVPLPSLPYLFTTALPPPAVHE